MRPRRRRAARVRGGSRFAAQDKGSLSLPGRQPAPRLRATERAASEGTACFPPAAPPQELCGLARTPGRAVASALARSRPPAHVVVPGSSRAPASWPSPRCRHSAPEVTARLRRPRVDHADARSPNGPSAVGSARREPPGVWAASSCPDSRLWLLTGGPEDVQQTLREGSSAHGQRCLAPPRPGAHTHPPRAAWGPRGTHDSTSSRATDQAESMLARGAARATPARPAARSEMSQNLPWGPRPGTAWPL